MVSYWRLGDTTQPYQDYLSSRSGSCSARCPIPVGGVIGNAQLFNGTDTGINVAANSSLDWGAGGSFSIEFWMQRNSANFSSLEVLVGRNDGQNSSLQWWIGINSSGRVGVSLIDRNGNGSAEIMVGDTSLLDGEWHHVVLVRDGINSQTLLYVDGIFDSSPQTFTYPAGFQSASAPLNIGWLQGGSSNYGGRLDELALYNRVLSYREIKQHFNDGLVGLRWGYCESGTTVKIMPLGDSITRGYNDSLIGDEGHQVGYRQKLYGDLALYGYHVDFVGSLVHGNLAQPGFDVNHEGHSGITAGQVANNIYGWLGSSQPEIILLHIGTNALTLGTSAVEAILNEIDRYSEEIVVVLARIINRREYSATTASYNQNLEDMANSRIANGDKIVIVDMESVVDNHYDMDDLFHPASAGYEKMSQAWFAILESILPVPSFASPAIVSSPVDRASIGYLYTYDVNATGVPDVFFSLLAAPSGMTIDRNSGLIQWFADIDGIFNVSVLGENSEGSDIQNYFISILQPGDVTLRINVGGGQYTDVNGDVWATDYGYNTGRTSSTTVSINGTLDDPLFQRNRWDLDSAPELIYSFDVPNGNYTVSLYFAETYSGAAVVGGRVFDILMEEQLVQDNLDIYSEAGINTALVKSYPVSVIDGQLNIEFLHNIENPSLSAIKIVNSVSTPDTVAPTTPTGISLVSAGLNEIHFNWNSSTDSGGSGVAGYRIFRDNVAVGTSTETEFVDTGLAVATAYSYIVSAFDHTGNESSASPAVTFTTLAAADTTAPSIPTGLAAPTVTSSQIVLSWEPSTDTGSGVAGYVIYRDGVEVGTSIDPGYSDTGLQPETEYSYTVSAYDNQSNESSESSSLQVITLESALRINAGGGAFTDVNGDVWAADYGYNTGRTSSTSVGINGTLDDLLFQKNRWDLQALPELVYSFDVANGNYTVNLYFAETYSGAAVVGGRVFDILMEEQLVQDNLDIYSEAGINTALMKSYPVSVTDGQLNIKFLHNIENPSLGAIEIFKSVGTPDTVAPTTPTGLAAQTVTSSQIVLSWEPSTDTGSGVAGYVIYRDGVEVGTSIDPGYSDTGLQPETEYSYTVSAYDYQSNGSSESSSLQVITLEGALRINAGGGTYTDVNGDVWAGDYGYNTGRTSSTSVGINGTLDDLLFQKNRWDLEALPELVYSFDVANGNYTVNLYFAETYSGAAVVGGRVFDILMEEQLVQDNLDIYSEVGANTALMKSYPVTVTDGQLNIKFLHNIENPTLGAIEIF
jgi:chitodextrinase